VDETYKSTAKNAQGKSESSFGYDPCGEGCSRLITTRTLAFLTALILGGGSSCRASDWVEDERDRAIQEPQQLQTATFGAVTAAPDISHTMALLDQIADLEQAVFKQSFSSTDLVTRVSDLEVAVFQETRSSLALQQRVEDLAAALGPQPTAPTQNSAQTSSSSKRNWFLNPAPMPMVDALGRGLKTGAKSIMSVPKTATEGTQKVLTSPLFWGAAAGAGLAVGGYFILKNNKGGVGYRSGYGSNYGYHDEKGCSGNMGCNDCKTCQYCKHCNSGSAVLCGRHPQVLMGRYPPPPY
jgi:hypothetical protein